jgi:peptidylprolyl isomerase
MNSARHPARPWVLFGALALAACSSSQPAAPADAASEATTLDAGGINADASAGDAATALDPKDYPLPDGFVGMPFLTEQPLRKFTKAEVVTDVAYNYLWIIETDQGRIEIDLHLLAAPLTANSCVFLNLHHYYDGQGFHRVIEGFAAQAGDPNSLNNRPATWGTGGPGYKYATETNPEVNFDGAGVVGSARGEALNTNGSQFFITLAAAADLNQKYTVFGKVRSGLDVLPKIVRGEPPTTPTRITRTYVGRKKI